MWPFTKKKKLPEVKPEISQKKREIPRQRHPVSPSHRGDQYGAGFGNNSMDLMLGMTVLNSIGNDLPRHSDIPSQHHEAPQVHHESPSHDHSYSDHSHSCEVSSDNGGSFDL